MSDRPSFPLRAGTRSSALAMTQARLVAAALRQAHQLQEAEIALLPVQTVGDRVQDRALAEIGGKALWTKELDQALFDDRIDFAVHSMKDVETALPAGIVIAAVLPRADPRDRLLGVDGLADLPRGAIVGTSSPRRAAQLRNRRPDVRVVNLRGNVETRMRHVAEGRVQATFLAAAGLQRLQLQAGVPLPIDDWLPASAQGIIGITCRADDERMRMLLAAIHDGTSFACLLAERAVLEGIGGDCHTAVAVHASLAPDHAPGKVSGQAPGLRLRAELYSPDGQQRVDAELAGDGDPRRLGLALAGMLLQQASPAIRASLARKAAD